MPTIFKWIKKEVAKEQKNRNELCDFFRPRLMKFSFYARFTYIVVVDAMHSILYMLERNTKFFPAELRTESEWKKWNVHGNSVTNKKSINPFSLLFSFRFISTFQKPTTAFQSSNSMVTRIRGSSEIFSILYCIWLKIFAISFISTILMKVSHKPITTYFQTFSSKQSLWILNNK